jgi:hypothetical protein
MKKILSFALLMFVFTGIAVAGPLGNVGGGIVYTTEGFTTLTCVTGTATELDVTNLRVSGTNAQTGVQTFTAAPVFNGGVDINEDVDIDFDAYDEEFNLTTSTGGTTAAMTLYNSHAAPVIDMQLLRLNYAVNGDTNAIFMQCYDNSAGDKVFQIGSDGVITIDASGGGSGTTISESTLTANDAAFNIRSTSGLVFSTASAVDSLTLSAGGGLTSLDGFTAGTSFIIGSADMNETDLEKLDGITDGTAAASKALVLDASSDISGINDITATGVIGTTVTVSDKLAFSDRGQTIYKVVIATSLADTQDYAIATPDGKKAAVNVYAVGHASGGSATMDTDGSITLIDHTNMSNTNNNDTTLNLYDDGTSMAVENQLGGTYTIIVEIIYIE